MGLLKQAIVIAVVLALLSLLILVGVGLPSGGVEEPVNEAPYYIAVIEAGSEDSKVYAYKFDQIANTLPQLHLSDTNFVKVKPGLFAFADTPSEVDAGVISLIAHVDTFIPSEKRPYSPLLLRAPSAVHWTPYDDQDDDGDRSENDDSTEWFPKGSGGGPTPLLLRAARMALFRSGYAVPGLESAAVIEPQQRAMYVWYSANYLMENFKWQNTSEATIDLDWDSMKIAYEPSAKELELLNAKDIYEIPFEGKIKKVFAKSYISLGLLDLRFQIFEAERETNLTFINSSCVNPEIEEEEWTFNSIVYKIGGAVPGLTNENGRPAVDFEKCASLVDGLNLEELTGDDVKLPHQLPGFIEQSKVVIGAPHMNRIQVPDEIDWVLSGAKYLKRAKELCGASPGAAEQNGPFACLDMLLLRRLLGQAVGLDDDEDLLLQERVDETEINWALGFAHSQLTKHVLLTTAN